MTIFWLIFTVVTAVLEGLTVQLVSVWFAIGGLAACITSLFTDSIPIQAVVFVVVTAIALVVTRPLVKKLRKKKMGELWIMKKLSKMEVGNSK